MSSPVIDTKSLDLRDIPLPHYGRAAGPILFNDLTEAVIETGIAVPETPTARALRAMILQEGHIPFSVFMRECIAGADGYYSQGKVRFQESGADGHFATACTTSPVFGWGTCLIANAIWKMRGAPQYFRLIEQGPGNCRHLRAIFDCARTYLPDFYDALRVAAIDVNQQAPTASAAILNDVSHKLEWITGDAARVQLDLDEGMLVSNELPDAFEVERIITLRGCVLQKYITIHRDHWVEEWDLPSAEVQRYLQKYPLELLEGVEEPLNLKAVDWMARNCCMLRTGAIYTVDYGHLGSVGCPAEPAVRCYGVLGKHLDKRDPQLERFPYLAWPGEVDMTSSINFTPLAQVAGQAGWSTAFAGLQRDALLQAGVCGLLRKYEAELPEIRSWRRLLDADELFETYVDMMWRTGGFFAQLLVRGLEGSLPWSAPSDQDYLYAPALPPLQLPVTTGESSVIVDLSATQRWGSCKSVVIAVEHGRISLLPSQIPGAVVSTSSGLTLLDLRDGDVLDQVLAFCT